MSTTASGEPKSSLSQYDLASRPTRIRPAKYQDLPAIAEIYAAALHDEGLNVVLFPYRVQHPKHYLRAWRHKVTEHWWDYKKRFFVSCEVEGERDVVVGVAEWTREGDGWERVWGLLGWWDPRLLIQPLLRLSHTLHRLLLPNLASSHPTPSSPHPLTFWNWEGAMFPYVVPLLTPPAPHKSFLELSLLGVRPSHYSLGHGRRLTTHGLGLARTEGVPAVVIAAEQKETFYQRYGFGRLVGWATEGEGNPLRERGVRGGAVLWTEMGKKEDDGEGKGERGFSEGGEGEDEYEKP